MPRIKLEEALLEEDERQEIERECMDALEDAELLENMLMEQHLSAGAKRALAPAQKLTFSELMKKLNGCRSYRG